MFEMIDFLEPRWLLAVLDPTFGENGAAKLPAAHLAVQADGKLLTAAGIAPTRETDNFNSFGVRRINADGSLDSSFGIDGVATVELRDDPRSGLSTVEAMDD